MKPLKRAAVTVIIAYVVFICSQNCRKVPQGGKIRLELRVFCGVIDFFLMG